MQQSGERNWDFEWTSKAIYRSVFTKASININTKIVEEECFYQIVHFTHLVVLSAVLHWRHNVRMCYFFYLVSFFIKLHQKKRLKSGLAVSKMLLISCFYTCMCMYECKCVYTLDLMCRVLVSYYKPELANTMHKGM